MGLLENIIPTKDSLSSNKASMDSTSQKKFPRKALMAYFSQRQKTMKYLLFYICLDPFLVLVIARITIGYIYLSDSQAWLHTRII